MVAVLDAHGRILQWNRACEDVLGQARRDVLGHALWEVLASAADVEEIRDAVTRLRRGEQRTRFESRNFTRGGGRYTIAWHQQAQRDARGNLMRIVVTGVGVTAKETEGALLHVTGRLEDMRQHEMLLAQEHEARLSAEHERSRLEAILQSAPNGMLYVEAGSQRAVVNSALCRMLPGTVCTERGPARYLGELRHPHGAPIAPEDMPWLRALRGELVVAEQICVAEAAGGQAHLIVHASPVRSGDEAISGAVVSFQDISARYQLEQLQRDYVSLISHDLGGPLNAMTMGVRLLQELHASQPSSTAANVIKKIEQSCQVMRSMIDDLMDIGRLESGWLELRWARVALPSLVASVLDSSLSEPDRARVRLVHAGALAPIILDTQRIGRVVLNLVSNALKYSPADSPVDVVLEAGEERAIIAVRDQGPGVEPAEARRLFEKHYRTEVAGHIHQEGAGLGLYICRLIVDAHGGDIRIESTPGQGATFRVSLPMRPPVSDPEG